MGRACIRSEQQGGQQERVQTEGVKEMSAQQKNRRQTDLAAVNHRGKL